MSTWHYRADFGEAKGRGRAPRPTNRIAGNTVGEIDPLEERDGELAAVGAANRELMTQLSAADHWWRDNHDHRLEVPAP